MARSFGKIVTAASAAVAAVAMSSPASARPMSIRALAAQEVQLATIAYRIAAANAASCRTREAITGLVLHDLTRYERNLRPAVSRAFSLNGGFGVLAIVPGSVAAQAGLRVDDEILAIGRYGVDEAGAWQRDKSYRRMEQFRATVGAALKNGGADLLVRRGGALLRIPLRAQHGCGGLVTLTPSATTNAWADGRHVVVTTGMTALSRSTDEIAFVIAHEMAHNILGHSGGRAGSRGIFGFARVRRGEIEADGYAVRLMANAGYQAAGGISFLETARRKFWWNMSLDHPGFGQRVATIAAAMRAMPTARVQTAVSRAPSPAPAGAGASVPVTFDSRFGAPSATASLHRLPQLAAAGTSSQFRKSCGR